MVLMLNDKISLLMIPTFPHVTKGILVGFVGAHSAWHVRCVHAGLIGGVRSHVLSGKGGVTSIGEGVLQIYTAPTRDNTTAWQYTLA